MTTDRADILGTDPRRLPPTDGLWAEFPEVANPRPSVAMTGASQEAREAIAPHLTKLQGRVLVGIAAHGPCTRDFLAETLGMSPNTLRPRVKELLDLHRIHVRGYTCDHPRRELLAIAPPTPPEE